jgi:hypothetical protein
MAKIKIDPAASGYLVTFEDGGECFYFKAEAARWKSDEFEDRGRAVKSIEPLFKRGRL